MKLDARETNRAFFTFCEPECLKKKTHVYRCMELTAASFMSVKKKKKREKERKKRSVSKRHHTFLAMLLVLFFFFVCVCVCSDCLSLIWTLADDFGEKKTDSDKRNKGNWKGFASFSNAELRGSLSVDRKVVRIVLNCAVRVCEKSRQSSMASGRNQRQPIFLETCLLSLESKQDELLFSAGYARSYMRLWRLTALRV